jgi:RNA polymerase primary sigma factor
MDAPLGDDSDAGNLYDVLGSKDSARPDSDLMDQSLKEEVERALNALTPREADVLRLYFGIEKSVKSNLTLEEIGIKFDLTRERVRQIKEKAIRRLKHSSRSAILLKYLG